MPAGAAQREATGVDCLDGTHRVAFDAGYLDQAADRIAGQPQVVLHGDLGRYQHLPYAAPQALGQRSGSHRRRYADLGLATAHSRRDGGALFEDGPQFSGRQQKPDDLFFIVAVAESREVL